MNGGDFAPNEASVRSLAELLVNEAAFDQNDAAFDEVAFDDDESPPLDEVPVDKRACNNVAFDTPVAETLPAGPRLKVRRTSSSCESIPEWDPTAIATTANKLSFLPTLPSLAAVPAKTSVLQDGACDVALPREVWRVRTESDASAWSASTGVTERAAEPKPLKTILRSSSTAGAAARAASIRSGRGGHGGTMNRTFSQRSQMSIGSRMMEVPPPPPPERVLRAVVVSIFVVIVAAFAVIYVFHFRHVTRYRSRVRITMDADHRLLWLTAGDEESGAASVEEGVLAVALGVDLPWQVLPYDCSDEATPLTDYACLRWGQLATLTVQHEMKGSVGVFRVSWRRLSDHVMLRDCVALRQHLYGGGLWLPAHYDVTRAWRRELRDIKHAAFITTSEVEGGAFGPVLRPLWMTSHGFGVHVDDAIPLRVSLGNRSLIPADVLRHHLTDDNDLDTGPQDGFYGDSSDRYLCVSVEPTPQVSHLNYTIYRGQSLAQIEVATRSNASNSNTPIFERVTNSPHTNSPLWSTDAHLGNYVTQDDIMTYIQNVSSIGYGGDIVLGLGWEAVAGDMTFDLSRFPNASELTKAMRAVGGQLWLSVHPFVNTDSKRFRSALEQGWLLARAGSNAPALVASILPTRNTSQPLAKYDALLDVNKVGAMSWLRGVLTDLRAHTNVSRFLFLGGTTASLPYPSPIAGSNDFTQDWANFAETYGEEAILNCQYSGEWTQKVIMPDLPATWDGLRRVIPQILSLSISGYPLFVPSAVGGKMVNGRAADRELYIRWSQLASFLPIVLFSRPPWFYDEAAQTIVQAAVEMHHSKVASAVRRAYPALPTPLVRPLNWHDMSAPEEHCITQFFVGDSLLVAPVLNPGASNVTLYLPAGCWADSSQPPGQGAVLCGPDFFTYHVTLATTPHFTLVT